MHEIFKERVQGENQGETMEQSKADQLAALTLIFEQLPENLQEAVIDIVTDFYHLVCLERLADSIPQDGGR
jgi:hypothetical protein